MPYDQEQRAKKPEKTLASIKNKYQTNIRREQLQQIFKSIRHQVQHSFRQKQQQALIYPSMYQPLYQPLTPAYLQYIQEYLVRCGAPQSYQRNLPLPLPQPSVPVQEPIIVPSIKPPIEEDIYFQKENFRIYKRLIGEGTFSKVWEGVNLITNQKIAAKQIKKLEDHQSNCLKTLSSPFIVKIHAILKHKNLNFIILEYCQRNLRQELDHCNYELSTVLKFFEQMLEGMNVLQSKNFIHRDLKFQNILVSNGTVKIADFGLAKSIGDELQVESRRCGTPYTMAPEIYFSRDYKTPYSAKCDIWSLGVILHEMLYQKHPFGFNQSDFKRKKRVSIQKRFGILDQLIEKCLVFKPEKRIGWNQVISIYQKYLKAKERFMDIQNFPINAQSLVYQDPKYSKSVQKKEKLKYQKLREEAKKEQEERHIRYLQDYNPSIIPKQTHSKRQSSKEKSVAQQHNIKKKKIQDQSYNIKESNLKKDLNSRDLRPVHHIHPPFYKSKTKESKKDLFLNHRRRVQRQHEMQLRQKQNGPNMRLYNKPEKDKTQVQTIRRQVYYLQSPKREEIKRGRIMGEMAVIILSIIFICIFICF